MSVIQSPFVSDHCVPSCVDKDANYNFIASVQNCSSSQNAIKISTRTLSFGPSAGIAMTSTAKEAALRVSTANMPTSGTSLDEMLRPHVVVSSAADIGGNGKLYLPDSAPAGTVVVVVNSLTHSRGLQVLRLTGAGLAGSAIDTIAGNATISFATKFINFGGDKFVAVPTFKSYM